MDIDLLREIRRLIEPLERKLRLVASKAIVELVKDDVGLQGVQVSALPDEVTDDRTEHMQPGGLTHKPLAGAEGLYLSIGGVRDDGVVICVSDRRHRPKELQDGETCLYSEGEKQSTITLKQDGSIEVSAHTEGDTPSRVSMRATGEIEIFSALDDPSSVLLKNDGAVEITAGAGGNVSKVLMKADGNVEIQAAGSVLIGEGAAEPMVLGNALKAWLEAHTHPTAMGPSGPPIEAATLTDTLSVLHAIDE